MNTLHTHERWRDAAAVLALAAVATLVFWLLPLPARAHEFECGKEAGIQKLRCERHEKMYAKCGAIKGEAHFVCDREFLLAHPLQCTGLEPADAKCCEAELAAFKTCEPKAGREFLVCVRDAMKASPMGPQ